MLRQFNKRKKKGEDSPLTPIDLGSLMKGFFATEEYHRLSEMDDAFVTTAEVTKSVDEFFTATTKETLSPGDLQVLTAMVLDSIFDRSISGNTSICSNNGVASPDAIAPGKSAATFGGLTRSSASFLRRGGGDKRKSENASSASSIGVLLLLIGCTLLLWVYIVSFKKVLMRAKIRVAWNRIFPMVRLLLSMSTAYVGWSFTLHVLQKGKVNYLYVMNLPTTSSVGWRQCLEYGLWMMLVALTAPLGVVLSLQEGFPQAGPCIMAAAVFIFVATVACPIREAFHKTRNAFFSSFWRCMKEPFGAETPTFQDFFVADWGTSLAICLQDWTYLSCYYIILPVDHESFLPRSSGGNDDTCAHVRSHWSLLVATIPYFWRACHTIKMYRKKGNVAHLVNHGKYLSMLAAYGCMWCLANAETTASIIATKRLVVAVWVARILSQLYAFAWDILMDWGWIQGKLRGMMFQSRWTYLVAGVVDLAARMFFIVAALYIQAVVEILRRSLWSVFRLENENLNNLETYRRHDFVPPIIDEYFESLVDLAFDLEKGGESGSGRVVDLDTYRARRMSSIFIEESRPFSPFVKSHSADGIQ